MLKISFLGQSETTETTSNSRPKNIKSDTKLINLLRQAIEATEEDDGWAGLGPVGSNISNRTSFDCRNYGFKNLSSLFKAIDLFELKRDQGKSYLVRDARKSKKA